MGAGNQANWSKLACKFSLGGHKFNVAGFALQLGMEKGDVETRVVRDERRIADEG
jgi:hypothetical protein